MTASLLLLVGVLCVLLPLALARSARSRVARVGAALLGFGFAAFCGFGFLAAAEPLDGGMNGPWRLAYAILGPASFGISTWLCMKRATHPARAESRP